MTTKPALQKVLEGISQYEKDKHAQEVLGTNKQWESR